MAISRELILRFDRPATFGPMVNFLEEEYLLVGKNLVTRIGVKRRRKYCAAGGRINPTVIFHGKAADVKDTRTRGGAESRARFTWSTNPRQVSGHHGSILTERGIRTYGRIIVTR